MVFAQIYELMNNVTKEVLGETAVVNEDLSNVVDIGKAVFDSNAVDSYVKALVNHIGRVIFTDRKYNGSCPSVLLEGWDYGSILEKISIDMPEAQKNDSWDLQDKQTIDPNVFYKPSVTVKFYNARDTFEIPYSITEKQIKQSFSSAEQLNSFISAVYNAVEKSMVVKLDALIMRTINMMIGQTLYSEYPDADYGAKSGVRAVNLLKLYNEKSGESLTVDKCLNDPNFIKYASYVIGLYTDRLSKISTLFNVGKKERFTPKEQLHIVFLTEFDKSSRVYLESDTFHNELVTFPKGETVPYWQGSGTDYSFSSTSSLDVKIDNTHTVKLSGVLGVMFDHEALGVCCIDKRVTTNYNPRGEYYTNFYKFDAGYFADLNENFVVFFVG